jgi:hypothetical protein
MIPKIIHYVWVGDNKKPDLVTKCIASWKKYCPDYEIIEWNNNSLRDIDNLYLQQAFQNRKWAFVSDYLRVYALYKYGGFYFDSDLEITQPIELFHQNKFVSGYERWKEYISPITALMGAEKSNKIIKDFLDEYTDLSFIKPDGSMDQTTNTIRIKNYFSTKYNLNPPYDGTKVTELGEDGIIYPYFYFCTPLSNKKNYAIHHFNGSWHDSHIRDASVAIGIFKIVIFRKTSLNIKTSLPISNQEKIICCLNLNNKKICLIKKI